MNKQLSLFCSLTLFLLTCCSVGSLQAQSIPPLDWAKSVGGSYRGINEDASNAMVTDGNGNVYITGSFCDTVDFDPGSGVFTMISNGSRDAFILKLDVSGNFVWAKQLGGQGTGMFNIPLERGNDIQLDPFGNLLICGLYGGTVDFDPGPEIFEITSNPGLGDAFILKLDTTGNFIWAKSIGTEGLDNAEALSVDIDGNIFVTGRFEQTVDFDPGPDNFSMTAGTNDIYTLKLDAEGNFSWAVQFFASGVNGSMDITVDNLGHVYIAGYTRVYPAAGAQWGGAGAAITIWKLQADSGDEVWMHQSSNEVQPGDYASGIAWDPNGYLYVCGYFSNQVNFSANSELGMDTATSQGAADIFVFKMDTLANIIWFKTMGASGSDVARAIALDASMNVYVTGSFQDMVDFDPGSGVANLSVTANTSLSDMFVLKLDSAGNYKWAYSVGSEGYDYYQDVNVDVHGVIYTTGIFGAQFDNATADFDPGAGEVSLVSNGGADIFVQRLICDDTTSITLTDTVCESYTLNGVTYAESGTYNQVRPNAAGCDSVITLQLTISVPEAIITVNEFTLGTTLSYATYQWLLNGAPISGATQPNYTVTANGNYAVSVTNTHGCADTSEIYIVDNVGIEDAHVLASQVSIYPNPAHDQVFIQSPIAVDMTLSGIDGRVMRSITDAGSFSVSDLAAGVYLLRLTDKDGVFIKIEKLVKQNK